MIKKFFLTAFVLSPCILFASWYNPTTWFQSEQLTFAGPTGSVRYERELTPEEDSKYYLGTTTPTLKAWKGLIVDEICLAGDCQTAWSAGAGEANTASNLGTGLNIFDTKSGVDLRFNSLSAGSNITLSTTSNANTIVISSTGGGGSSISFNPLQAQWFLGTSTATSTFKGGLQSSTTISASVLESGYGQFGYITATSTATSTFAGGINLTGGGLKINGLTSELLKVDGNGTVFEAVSGVDYSNFGTTVGPTELQATDFGDFTCNGTICSLDTTFVTSVSGTANQIVSSGGATPTLSLANGLIFPNTFYSLTGTTTLFESASSTIGRLTVGSLIATSSVSFPAGSITNTMLQNSTISGIALGSNLNSLSNGSTLLGTSYNGSASVSDWDIDLSNPNTWTGKQTFGNEQNTNGTSTGTTYLNLAYLASTTAGNMTIGTLTATSSLTLIGASTGCATFTSGVLSSTGVACGTSNGANPFDTNTSWGALVMSTTSRLAFPEGLISSTTIGRMTVGTLTATSSVNLPAGSVDNSELANSTITFGSGSLTTGSGSTALGGTGFVNLALQMNPLTIGSIVATTSATSTFAGGLYASLVSAPIFNATSTTATSTFMGGININGGNLKISTLLDCNGTSVLETDANGNLQCGADGTAGGLTGGSTNALTYWTDATTLSATSSPTIGWITATSTATSTFNGPITLTTASATSTFSDGVEITLLGINRFFATSTTATSSIAGGLNVLGGGITDGTVKGCNTGNALATDANGVIICDTDDTGTGATYPFTPTVVSGITYSATSSPLMAPNSLWASSTIGNLTVGTLTATSSLTLGGTTFTALIPTTRALTIAGTANQITSSAGSQDLSADRTWTLSLPNAVTFPNSFFSTSGTSTLFASASSTIGNLTTGTFTATSSITLIGASTGCATFTSGVLSSTGVACGSGGGTNPFDTNTSWGALMMSTTSRLAFPESLISSTTIGRMTVGSITATSSVSFPAGSITNTMLQNSTISGVALGSNLNSLSNGSTLIGTSYNGSASVSDWDIDLSNPNTWTGLITYNAGLTGANATSSGTFYSMRDSYLASSSIGKLTVGSLTATSTVSFPAGSIAIASLAASTISGVSLGNNLNALTNDTTLIGSSYNGSGAVSDWGIDLSNVNSWTGKQTFYDSQNTNGTSTGTTYLNRAYLASTTAGNFTVGTITATSSMTVVPLTSALILTGSGGLMAEYTGTSCTNQFVRSIDALGVATCATVSSSDVSLANLTATDSTLTFSGTYNGSTARTIGLNLGNANTWTGVQTFGNATSSVMFGTNLFYSASSTIGRLVAGTMIATSSLTAVNASTTNFSVGTWLGIPTSDDPAINTLGTLAINTTAASSSLRFATTTGNETALFPYFDKPTIHASSTLAYDGGYSASGTTTYNMWNPSRKVALYQIYCKTNTGTVWYEIGTGSASSTIQCTSTGTLGTKSITFGQRDNVYEAVGVHSGNPSRITVTPTFYWVAD